MGKMFELLKEGLEEALEYHRGNVKLRTKVIFIPDIPKDYKAKDIKNLRGKLKFSQQAFASWLNVSLNTIQAWEQGGRKPNHASLRLLELFDKGFSSIEEICKTKSKVDRRGPQKQIVHKACSAGLSKGTIAAKGKR